MQLPRTIDRLWRKWFGTFAIDDPRPIAESAPYTFFLPSDGELHAVAPGDQVKLIFRSIPDARDFDAERMWVTVTAVDGDTLSGTLDNHPGDMPQLPFGTDVSFPRSSVIDIMWDKERPVAPPSPLERRSYWERCMVDACVVGGRSPVDYIYREEPDLGQPDDKYADSGWRIRGTDAGIEEDERIGEEPAYVALGAVLNRDDSWLHLIDEPTGARFIRDLDTGKFEVCSED